MWKHSGAEQGRWRHLVKWFSSSFLTILRSISNFEIGQVLLYSSINSLNDQFYSWTNSMVLSWDGSLTFCHFMCNAIMRVVVYLTIKSCERTYIHFSILSIESIIPLKKQSGFHKCGEDDLVKHFVFCRRFQYTSQWELTNEDINVYKIIRKWVWFVFVPGLKEGFIHDGTHFICWLSCWSEQYMFIANLPKT